MEVYYITMPDLVIYNITTFCSICQQYVSCTIVIFDVLMYFQYGFNLVFAHPHAINCIALSLNHRSLR